MLKRFFLLFYILFWGLYSFSQERVNDARMWLRLGTQVKVNAKLKWVTKAQIGWEDNAQKFDFVYLRNELQYKLGWGFSALANYTIYEQQTKREQFRTGHRLAAGFKYSYQKGLWEVQLRSLFLSRWNALLTDEEGFSARYRNRNRISLSYDVSQRTKLLVQNEIYVELNRANIPYIGANRAMFGLSYKWNKRTRIEPNFILIHRDQPYTRDFVYRLSYFYNF